MVNELKKNTKLIDKLSIKGYYFFIKKENMKKNFIRQYKLIS